jgi:acetyltransferase-like isoleucine patch superfamily enzyme
MHNKERCQSGLPYICDSGMLEEQNECRIKLAEFNACPFEEKKRMEELIRSIFGRVGKNPWINAPFRCDYGYNIHIGDNLICNYNCVMLDVASISIGNNVQIAPNVTISAAGHPVHPETRNTLYEYGRSIVIGDDVWIGAGVVINPGITIGNGAVIGSGSIVTKDIPPMVIAVGNPCRVIREITEDDRYKYYKNEEFDIDPFK